MGQNPRPNRGLNGVGLGGDDGWGARGGKLWTNDIYPLGMAEWQIWDGTFAILSSRMEIVA